jgi:hypothetical protein
VVSMRSIRLAARRAAGSVARAARRRRRVCVALALLVGVGTWLLVGALLAGESRRAFGVVLAVRDGVVAGDTEAVLARVSPEFMEEGMDRAALRSALAPVLAKRPVSRAEVVEREAEVARGRAFVRVLVYSSHAAEWGTHRATSEWKVELCRHEDEWLVHSAEPLSVDERQVGGLWSVLALAH